MGLDAAALADDFIALFEGRDGYPDSARAAGESWAALYRRYAADAAAAVAAPPPAPGTAPLPAALTAAETVLAPALAGAFAAAHDGGPAGVGALATALDGAFAAFWFGPPVAFALAGPPSFAGVVTLAPPGVLGPALGAVFAAGTTAGRTAADQARALTEALHTWTRTVQVTNTPVNPPGPMQPSVGLS
jgi:hypothetical protein